MTPADATATSAARAGDVPDAPAGPAVVFAEGRRPETSTRVQLEAFDGPLALLLSLIEARQLDVLTVPLGALADAYLDALAGLEADRIGNVSAFVAVASQLILIKSRAMLPRRELPAAAPPGEEVDDPEAELRARLLLYRAHREAGTRLQVMALEVHGLFRREPGLAHAAALAGARPSDGPRLDPAVLVRALDGLARLAIPPELPPEVVPRTITLAERAAIIRSALAEADVIVLQDLLRGTRDRVVVAVTFLAMLELMKRREIVVSQDRPWGPIVARRTSPEERGAAGGPDGSEDLPFDESLESYA
jgi:segregation and condensation protein A